MSDIQVELCDVRSLVNDDWAELQAMEMRAYTTGGFSPEEANALLFGDDLKRYVRSRSNPQSEVGVSLPGGLQVYEPRLVLARQGERFVGSLATAITVSGRPIERGIKRHLMPSRNYLWVKSLAVAEDQRRGGVAARMGSCLVRDLSGRLRNPVVAYVYPEKTPEVAATLREHSFVEAGSIRAEIIPGGEEHTLLRFESPRLACAAAMLGIVS